MSIFKSALAGATVLSLALASSAAYAESVRASGSLPGVISAKKPLPARTAAPSRNESKADDYVKGTQYPWGIFVGVTAAVGGVSYLVFRDGDKETQIPTSS